MFKKTAQLAILSGLMALTACATVSSPDGTGDTAQTAALPAPQGQDAQASTQGGTQGKGFKEELLQQGFKPLRDDSSPAQNPATQGGDAEAERSAGSGQIPSIAQSDAAEESEGVVNEQRPATGERDGLGGRLNSLSSDTSLSAPKMLTDIECRTSVHDFSTMVMRSGGRVITKRLKIGYLLVSDDPQDERFLFLAPIGVLNPPSGSLKNDYFRCLDDGSYYDAIAFDGR